LTAVHASGRQKRPTSSKINVTVAKPEVIASFGFERGAGCGLRRYWLGERDRLSVTAGGTWFAAGKLGAGGGVVQRDGSIASGAGCSVR